MEGVGGDCHPNAKWSFLPDSLSQDTIAIHLQPGSLTSLGRIEQSPVLSSWMPLATVPTPQAHGEDQWSEVFECEMSPCV